MSLTNYADLQTAVANWLGGRADLNAVIPDFITLFEKAANRRLRVQSMLTSADLTTVSGAATLPTDFLIWRDVKWLGNPVRDLQYAIPEWITIVYPTSPAGPPSYFTITSNNRLQTMPFDDTALTRLHYYQRVPPLANVGTNWLMTNNPDAYLFGALAESGGFTLDDNALAKWVARRDQLFEEIELLDKRGHGVGAMQIDGPTP
jgi:hypothetical protein